MKAVLQDLVWMTGPWQGALGEQTVQEDWSAPHANSMSTMVRLSSAASLDMIELIEIREADDTLTLHLRQFQPGLQLHFSGDFELQHCDAQGVSFVCPGARIESLAYYRQGADGMRVEVSITGGYVAHAQLQRPDA